MSSYELSARDPDHQHLAITAGWNRELHTLFASVIDTSAAGAGAVIISIGTSPNECRRPDEILDALAPYTDVGECLVHVLFDDMDHDTFRRPHCQAV